MPPPCTAVAPARSCGGRLAPPPPRASPLCCAAAPVLQVTLLITNIARFDAPQPWQQLLPDLLAAAAEDSPVPPAGKQRALTALKHVLQALKGGCLAGRAPSSCLLHFAAVCCRPGCWRTPTRGLGGCLKSALPLPQRIHPPPTALLLSPFTVCLQARSSSSQHPGTRATCPSRVSALPASTRCRPSHPFSTLPSCPNVQLATFPPSRKPCLTCPCPGCLPWLPGLQSLRSWPAASSASASSWSSSSRRCWRRCGSSGSSTPRCCWRGGPTGSGGARRRPQRCRLCGS
jgi:hypothetical protein